MINTSNPGENLCGLEKADFQKVIDGKQTDLFILKNESGAEVAITNYGGAVVAIMVPDKNGNYANVIQGHDTIDKVINSPEPFLSTLIGRYGNRIAKGKFLLDGKEYQLAVNNGPNHLHAMVLWSFSISAERTASSKSSRSICSLATSIRCTAVKRLRTISCIALRIPG